MILFTAYLRGNPVRYEKIPDSRLWRRSAVQPKVTEDYRLLLVDLKAEKIQGFATDTDTGEVIFVRDLESVEHTFPEYLSLKTTH